MVGPAWYGAYLFQPSTGLNTPERPTGGRRPADVGRAARRSTTGDVGGGLWIMSSHTAQPKAGRRAGDLAGHVQRRHKVFPLGYPAYVPAAKNWIAAQDAQPLLCQPVGIGLRPSGYRGMGGLVAHPYSTDAIWNSTSHLNLSKGIYRVPSCANFGTQLKNYAQSDGYSVVSKA